MWLFRRSLDLSRAAARPVSAADLPAVSRLLRDGGRRYYALSGAELPGILTAGLGVMLHAEAELWAVALCGWPAEDTIWLRAAAFAEGVELRTGTALLLTALHTHLAQRSLRGCYFTGDDTADTWLTPLLKMSGYTPSTDVIVYEKTDLAIPDPGNRDVRVRPALSVDLSEVLRIDHACFEPQWTKDDTVLGLAISEGPFFVLAEHSEYGLVGYAYATSHFNGRLVHLVRIAVEPRMRSSRIGVRLLAEVVNYAAAANASLITLNTQAYNLEAQRLYRWFGFTTSGERQSVLRYALS